MVQPPGWAAGLEVGALDGATGAGGVTGADGVTGAGGATVAGAGLADAARAGLP